jgi:hypothetical protein
MSAHYGGNSFLQDVLQDIASADGTTVSLHGIAHFLHHQPRMEFAQTNLVSDGSVLAAHTDPNLINPWGVAFSPTGPFWVSDAGTGVTTIYDGGGSPVAAAGHTVIDIAKDSSGHSTPTGQTFNSTPNGFQISADGVTAKSAFIFVTTQGTISGWTPTVAGGATSVIAVDKSSDGAAYTVRPCPAPARTIFSRPPTSAMARSMSSTKAGIRSGPFLISIYRTVMRPSTSRCWMARCT